MEDLTLWKLFTTIFKINIVTFGGGYTIVPVLREELSIKREIIPDEEMLNMVALSQSLPGAMAINLSILIGIRLFKEKGAFVCALASSLPSLIIITIISFFYAAFQENFFVNAILTGMSGVISAVLFLSVIDLAKAALKNYKLFSAFMMILAFSLAFFFNISTALIILFCGFMGLAFSYIFKLNKMDDAQ